MADKNYSIYNKENPKSDPRNCPDCLIGMIKKIILDDRIEIWQCSKCKNIEQL